MLHLKMLKIPSADEKFWGFGAASLHHVQSVNNYGNSLIIIYVVVIVHSCP